MSRHGSRPRGPRGHEPADRRPRAPRTPRDARRRELGQNFLVDDRAVARVLDLAGVAAGDLVVDLGAGRGAMTRPLAERGARVIAVELDPTWADRLRRDLRRHDRVEVVHGDALRVPLPTEPFRVVANPPYGRSTDVLRRLLAADAPLRDATLVLQRETARRVAAGGRSGAFHLSWAPWFDLVVVGEVPREAFRPIPKVDSAILAVTPRAVPSLSPVRCADWQAFVTRVFRTPGRTAADRLDGVLGTPVARRVTRDADVEVVRPPSRVPVEGWLALFRAIGAPR